MTEALLVSAGADPASLLELAGPRGWGLPFTWDTFGHGHPNPAGTAYACTTALAIEALIDAGAVDASVLAIAEAWGECWTDAWYWYSESPCDAICTPNAVALLAGATTRLGLNGAVRERADMAVARLVETHAGLRWRYATDRAAPNCLIHDAFVLWGVETYRAAGGRVEVPWTAAEAAASLRGRTDVGRWPAGGPAMRFALAARFAPALADERDLDAQPANDRDAAFRTFARSLR